MQAPIITLVTDWGTDGLYSGMFKGHLFSALPEARVVDITHELRSFDSLSATPVVRHACAAFPEGSIHIVDAGSHQGCRFIAAEIDGRFFLTADNGLLYSAFERRCDRAVLLASEHEAPGTFQADSLLLPAAVRLAQGTPLPELGPAVEEKAGALDIYYRQADNKLMVTITHTDSYGNAFLGITREEFDRIRAGRSFRMVIRDVPPITHLQSSYTPTPEGGMFFLVESCTGYLQVAMSQRPAEQLLGLKPLSSVLFEFS